jgi:hypothetical protein
MIRIFSKSHYNDTNVIKYNFHQLSGSVIYGIYRRIHQTRRTLMGAFFFVKVIFLKQRLMSVSFTKSNGLFTIFYTKWLKILSY